MPNALRISLVAFASVAFALRAPAAEKGLKIGYDDEGLSLLEWAGANLLEDGTPSVSRIVLEKKRLGDDGLNEYEFETLDGDEPKVRFDRARKVLTFGYDWGAVSFAYGSGPDRLNLAVTIRNDSKRTIAMFDVVPLTLSLPESFDRPEHWRGSVSLPGHFNVREITYGGQKLLLCCETVMPLNFGFGRPREKNTVLPVQAQGNVNMTEPGGVVYHHYGLPRVAPGESLTVKMSLRFASADSDNDKLIADMYEAFREYHQPRLVWTDRRPVGAIWMAHGKGPANNPRNWFKDKDLDVRTAAGKKELRERMLQSAERSVEILKGMNAQGVIVWDPEGAENPHPITFIGDPRMVKILAPEMEDIWPDFFRKFLDAGLRTGCCIRPTQVYLTPPAAACDDDVASRWSVQDFPQWVEVDFGAEKTVNRAEVVCHADRAYQYRIEAKPADGDWSTVIDRTDNTAPGKVDSPITDTFEPVKARRVRLTVTGAHEYDGRWISLREFRVFTPDGTNVCLNNVSDSSRPLGRTAGGHGTGAHNPDRNPLGDDFSDIWPEGVPAERFYPIVERMSRKIQYAKENWGCTLIYIDTNGVHRPVGEKQEYKWTLLDPHIWRELHKRHPDVLLIPEFAPNPGQLAYTSVYLQPPYSGPVTRPFWRKLLPGAFSVSYTVNLKRERWQELRPQLLDGVRNGDSMFFRGWFGDSYNPLIKGLYEEAYEPGEINPELPAGYAR